jgi:hypothetical protein
MKKVIILIILCISLPLHSATVKVGKVIGRAEYRKLSDKKWKKLSINMKLSREYRIRSGKASRVELICADGSKIILRNQVVFDIKELKMTKEKKSFSFKLFYEGHGIRGVLAG